MELVAPAGDFEKLQIAIKYGADAVYMAGQEFGLRAQAGNFSEDEIVSGVKIAHQNDVKIYAALNVFARNPELKAIADMARFYQDSGVDAVIVSDPGVFLTLKESGLTIPVHLSTQANTLNIQAARFWKQQGISRIVLGRELSIAEISAISGSAGVDVEIFVHGAMCVAYSGRCLLSMYLNGRDANAGKCSQPCRWGYQLVEKQRQDLPLEIEEDKRGSYILSSKDLCLLRYLPDLAKAGISALKIEGRMRSVYYLGMVVSVYRRALDALLAAPDNFNVKEEWLDDLTSVSHRGYTEAFAAEANVNGMAMEYQTGGYIRRYDFIGKVKNYNPQDQKVRVEQRGNFRLGQAIQFVGPRGERYDYLVQTMHDESGNLLDVARHPQQIIEMPCAFPVDKDWLVRRRIEGKDNY
jgi:putative protease